MLKDPMKGIIQQLSQPQTNLKVVILAKQIGLRWSWTNNVFGLLEFLCVVGQHSYCFIYLIKHGLVRVYFTEHLLDLIQKSPYIVNIEPILVHLIINSIDLLLCNLFSKRQPLLGQVYIFIFSHIGEVPTLYLLKYWFGPLKPIQFDTLINRYIQLVAWLVGMSLT